MARGGSQDFFELYGWVVLAAIVCATSIFLAIFVTPIALVGIGAYVGYRLYKESPRRAERLAREETMVLYNHALARNVHLSEDEIDAELAYHLPGNTPEALRIQLLAIGNRIFAGERIATEIPPPPALCLSG